MDAPAAQGDREQAVANDDRASEISTRVLSVFFRYFDQLYGRERLLRAVERIGGTPDLEYIFDPENFVSLEYCIRVANVLTEDSGDAGFIRKAGLFQLSDPSMLGFAFYLMRSLGSPRLYYRMAAKASRSYNRVGRMRVEELGRSRVRLHYHSLKPEGTRLLCEGRIGQLAAAPTLWGLPAAAVHERECQVLGAEACVYDLEWLPLARPSLRALLGALLGAGAGVLAIGLRAAPWGAIVGGLAVLAWSYRADSRAKSRHILDAAEASERSMAELSRRYDEVRRLNAEMERSHASLVAEMAARQRAETALVQAQKLEAVGRLSGGIAHDFNNILTIILNYAAFARANARNAVHVTSSLEAISAAARRAAGLTRQLLAFARRQIAEVCVLSLEEHLRSTEHMLGRLVGEDVTVVFDLAPEESSVLMDPGQLEQVLFNLAANARDAMPAGGTLRLSSKRVDISAGAPGVPSLPPGAYVVFSVSDTGHGMDEATRRRVFEPFFTTKQPGRGTGLGLASSHGIVAQAGGAITVDSAPNHGSTFHVTLPRVEARQTQRELHEPDPVRGGNERVLVVEDDAEVRKITVSALSSAGYRVLEARDGHEAIDAADRTAVDLLVTDVVMPGIDGHELAERLRAKRPDLRVLYTSGYPNDVIQRHGVRPREIHLVAKPFSVGELTRKVRETLDLPA